MVKNGNVDQIIINAAVVPKAIDREVIRSGFVAIHEDRIVALGPMDIAKSWMPHGVQITDAPWALVLPGLVNVHTHLAAGIFRGQLYEGLRGQSLKGRGLYDIAFPMEQLLEPDDIYWLGMLGCIEILKAGCTTFNDIYYFADRLGECAKDIGLRAILAEKMFDADLAQIGQNNYSRDAERRKKKFQASVSLIERWHGHDRGRITCRMGTHATDTCSKSFLQEAAAEAKKLDVGLHIHTAQSPIEMQHIRDTHHCTPVEYLAELDLLGPDTLTVHCSHNTDSDIDKLAATGTAYACCPTMYPRRGRFPRLWEFQKRGVRIGFGTDWLRMDPWEGMRNAMYAVRTITSDTDSLSSAELLHLQTMGSAEALGMADQIGSIEPGKKADLTLLNMDRPHLQPFYYNLAGLVYNVYPSDVHTVIVDGKTVVEAGQVKTIDEAAVLTEVKRRMPRYESWREKII